MKIQFVCRGNASRSLLAETYLRSLQIPNLVADSSGTVALANKAANQKYYLLTESLLKQHNLDSFLKSGYGTQLTQYKANSADILVFMNKKVCEEAKEIITIPQRYILWNIIDTGEPGREYNSPQERALILEEIFTEIQDKVRKLVNELR